MTDQQPTEATALDELAAIYGEAGHPDADTRRYAAELLARHAREMAEMLRELRSVTNAAMKGNRSRVGVCSGIGKAERHLAAYADRLDGSEQQGAQQQ